LEWRLVGDEVVALDVGASRYFGLNASAAVLWQLLADGATREEMVGELTTAFSVSPERAGADVDDFVARLRARDLVTA
jgi:hypothetical protein